MKFKIGDKVRVWSDWSYWFGKVGTVVRFSKNIVYICIEDKYIPYWDHELALSAIDLNIV